MGIDRPANDAAGVRVRDDAAVELSFPGGVFGDVGQPQLVRGIPGEVAADEILSGGDVGETSALLASGESFQRELAHQLVHQLA